MSAQENKEIVRRYFEGRFNEKSYAVVDEFLAASADIDGQKAWLDTYHAAWGDPRMELDNLIAEDDLVAVHFHGVATHRGEWEGFAPTGKRHTFHGMALCRLADGKIIEDTVNYTTEFEVLQAAAQA